MTSASKSVDLASLAHAYRLRPLTAAGRRRAAMSARASLDPLLDIGGGTGAQAAVWARAGRKAMVVDIEEAMVERAAQHPHVSVVKASSEALPFTDDSAGLAHFHMSIHYGDWGRALSEAARVVRPGGRIEVWTFAPASMDQTSLGRWFPTVAAIDADRFPDPAELAAHLAPMVANVELSRVDEQLERTASEWENAVRGRFVSTLQLIDDDELERGVAAFRAQFPADDAMYRYTAPFTTVTCSV